MIRMRGIAMWVTQRFRKWCATQIPQRIRKRNPKVTNIWHVDWFLGMMPSTTNHESNHKFCCPSCFFFFFFFFFKVAGWDFFLASGVPKWLLHAAPVVSRRKCQLAHDRGGCFHEGLFQPWIFFTTKRRRDFHIHCISLPFFLQVIFFSWFLSQCFFFFFPQDFNMF